MSATSLTLSHKNPVQHSYLPQVQDIALLSTFREVNGQLLPVDAVRYRFGSCPNFNGSHFRNVLLIDTTHNGVSSFSISYFKSYNDCLYYAFERMREYCRSIESTEIIPASPFWLDLLANQHIIKYHLVDFQHRRVKVYFKH